MAMTALRTALSLFTVLPAGARAQLNRADAVAALRWLPLAGAALGALAGLPVAAAAEWAPRAGLLGAVIAVAALALLTRGLHLDGLADTADGLGSRAAPAEALMIMRRSDIGPFGVLALVLVVLADVAALAALAGDIWPPVAGLAVAAATGRVAVLVATHRQVPSARSDGFGVYVAGSTPTWLAAAYVVGVLGFGVAMSASVGASVIGWPAAQAAALITCAAVQLHATRRLGGVTGDVFGALVEIGTAATLAGLAFS